MQIYLITNKINNKIYIGKNSTSDPNYMGSGSVLHLAKIKYGKNSFSKKILENNINSMNLLNEREIFWINYYKSTDPDIGYNRAPGGEGNSGKWNGDNLTDNHKNKISKALKGRNITWNDKLSSSRKKSKKVKKLFQSKEWKFKISNSMKGISKTDEHIKNLKKALNNSDKFKESRSSDEFKKKCSQWQKGKNRSLEYMEKWRKTRAKNTLIKQEKDKQNLLNALYVNNNNIKKTANYLGNHINTIKRKIKNYNIQIKDEQK